MLPHMSSQVPHSETARMSSFSDGVFSILITIMVLELKSPQETTISGLLPVLPFFLSYILSYVYLAIYWNNHHHLLHATKGITGGIMWANLHLLFWLSLIPFSTEWVGRTHGEALPAAVYGFVLLMSACAYFLLSTTIIHHQGRDSELAQALGSDRKAQLTIVLYVLAIVGSFIHSLIAYILFMAVALLWIVPDKRLAPLFDHLEEEKTLPKKH